MRAAAVRCVCRACLRVGGWYGERVSCVHILGGNVCAHLGGAPLEAIVRHDGDGEGDARPAISASDEERCARPVRFGDEVSAEDEAHLEVGICVQQTHKHTQRLEVIAGHAAVGGHGWSGMWTHRAT
jgi:hypothetical protein